ncbi:ClpP/crotonase [Tothia fuscella]|uniref:ClpP/crotonase n=1 Tax=Tothia fuscella TaxID=1048955 RepID=A0A9P4TXX4_9PEZI|nr:ClpP/crotonase [Tothia fuscella]
MKILFLCTAHNSLSQRLFLALSTSHSVTIEYALSDELMISAAQLAKPDLIICPFLTARVPKEIYNEYLTLIIHPGPPGDAGPSALDWVLLGDDGSIEDSSLLLESLDKEICRPGRTHWGITILQAIEEFDAGPVWAFEQFTLDIDQPGMTKSELYRGPVSRAAITAALVAVDRIQKAVIFSRVAAATNGAESEACSLTRISPHLKANHEFKLLSVGSRLPFQGGKTHDRPLLRAAQREFDLSRHTAQQISRRIRCADSQPGSLSKIFGPNLYVYGGIIDECPGGPNPGNALGAAPGTIVATRKEAVCISTCDGKGIWITHVRRLKRANDPALWPKVPATFGLMELGILTATQVRHLQWDLPNDWSKSPYSTFQEIWIDFETYGDVKQAAYLYFDFYNGAMATNQCSHLVEAMDHILSLSDAGQPIRAVVLMGGSYFSNGIALNVIEASPSPAAESWFNINRIDDVVHHLLHEFPTRDILTIAGVRGNAAAGGCALATACDLVIAGSEVVLNPAYRGVGLYGSEYHSLSYPGRCGAAKAKEILRSMTPMTPFEARSLGLFDHVFPGSGTILNKRIRNHVAVVVKSGKAGRALWRSKLDMSPSALAAARAAELNEMSKDFYSPRSTRYHTRRFNFVRKVKATQTPLRFATHRRFDANDLDEEECDSFDEVEHYQKMQENALLRHLQERLAQLNPASVNKSLEITVPPFLPSEKNAENMFSCYYPPTEYITSPSVLSTSPSSLYIPLPAKLASGV